MPALNSDALDAAKKPGTIYANSFRETGQVGYHPAMWSNKVLAALEEVSHLIGRLDARISLSPLAEAWQIRSCIMAAESLAAVDGTPTRSGDIAGLLLEAPLASPSAYGPAHAGLAHWRRSMARVDLSELAARLVGRNPAPNAAIAEMEADWEIEEELPAALRGTSRGTLLDDIDAFAREVGDRAVEIMRARQGNGAALIGLASAVQQAVRMDPDPDYFERVERRRREFVATAKAEAEMRKASLPSPASAREPELADKRKAQIDAWRDGFLREEIWNKPRHLGSCYAVIPDRLQELGLTSNRLSCLTGATKRLGFEARLDDRALLGFLRQMAAEARAGLALLDALESAMAKLGRSEETKFDTRSPFPNVLYAFLLLPAVDPGWLRVSLEIEERLMRKLMKRLTDAALVVHWADSKRSSLDGQGTRDAKLWMIAGFEKEYDLSLRRTAKPAKSNMLPIDAAAMLARHRDIDVSKPMAMVYERFDQDIIDIDREFGAFFDRRWWKNRPPRMSVEAKNQRSPSPDTLEGPEALYGA